MKFIPGLVVIAMAATVMPTIASAQVVIVVRHAERADGAATAGTGMQGSPDPDLSEVGKARAAKLAEMLASAGVTAIYTTEYARTKATAAPLAAKLNVTSEVVPAREQASLIQKLKSLKSGAALVVGHSNTVPAIVAAMGGPAFTIGDDEYDNLIIVGPGGVTTRLRFKP